MSVQLQVYSCYSLLQSTLSIDQLVKNAKAKGITHLALTDTQAMHGVIEFYNACKKHGIYPIIGLEAMIEIDEEAYPFILLAKDNQGYHALLKISSHLCSEVSGSIKYQDVLKYQASLFLFSSGMDGIIERLYLKDLDRLAEEKINYFKLTFKDHFYLNLQSFNLETQKRINDKLIQASKTHNIPLIATNAVRYNAKEDARILEVLLAIKYNEKLRSKENLRLINHEQYLKDNKEMGRLFDQSVLQNTMRLATRCQVELKYTDYLIPHFPVPNSGDSSLYLKELCQVGLRKRRHQMVPKIYQDRLNYELSVIDQMGFSDYFLIVWDFIRYAKKKGILVGPGRGSSAGSLVAYVLGIIDIDPIHYGLIFERFLNPERISMPDIDIDFPSHQRDEVIEYVKAKYGMKHVAHILTFGTFKPRLAIRDVCRVLAIPEYKVNQFLNYTKQYYGYPLSKIFEEDLQFKGFVLGDSQNKMIYRLANGISNLPKNISTHAAGIVIATDPLDERLPIRKDFSNDMMMTQFTMEDVEHIGLLKMDFLGIQNLTIISHIVDRIKLTNPEFKLLNIPLNDQKTFSLLTAADTLGIFQLESTGVRQVLRRLKVNNFEDIVATTALYRPGPMDNIPHYIARKHKEEKITYPHPSLEPILEHTYGIIVYQEQIMQIAQLIAGFSLGKADILRRAMSKKDEQEMLGLKDDFIQGGMKRGYLKPVTTEIFDLMYKFANYGFNRSHAVAYGMVAYQMAYLKANYPSLFMAELLANHEASARKLSMILVECRRLGIQIKNPSINLSTNVFKMIDQKVYFSLTSIAGVGRQVAKFIIDERHANGSYQDFYDFLIRLHTKLSEKIMMSMIDAGAFDEFNESRATLKASLSDGLLYASIYDEHFVVEKPIMIEVEDQFEERMMNEKAALGVYLSSHPLVNYYDIVKDQTLVPLEDYDDYANQTVRSLVYVPSIRLKKTKRSNEMMAYLSIQNEVMSGEAVVYPKTYRIYQEMLEKSGIYLVEGKVSGDQSCQIIVNKLKKLSL